MAVAVTGELAGAAEDAQPLLHLTRHLGGGARPFAHSTQEELSRADHHGRDIRIDLAVELHEG